MKCVYKIVCKNKEITECYIGSSVNFDRRKIDHKSHSKNLNSRHYCYPLYMFINVNGGWENWEIEVIKEYKFITKKELNINEQYYIELLQPHLNGQNAKGLDIERRKKSSQISDKNRSKIKATCDICGKEMRKDSIKKHIKTQH